MRRALIGLLAVTAATVAGASDFPQILKRGALRALAVHEDLFFSVEGGAPGFDRELLDGFCQLHKLKLEVVKLPGWDAMIPSLLEDKGDVIVGGYAATEARRKQIAFTVEVFPSRKVVMTRRPHAIVKSLEEFRAGKVGTVKGTSMAEVVDAAGVPKANVEYLPSGTLPEALRTGKVSAIVLGVEHAIVEQRKDPSIQLGLFLGAPGSLAFGLRKEDAELQKALNQYLDNTRKSPRWSQLVVKYFGDDALEVLKKAKQ